MSKTTSGTALPAGPNDEQQNLPPSQEQTESKLPRTELTLIKKLPQQIKEIVEQNARIEHQLLGMNKDIKQIGQTWDDKLAESEESIKQIQSQIDQLQTQVTKIGNALDNAFANIKSEKKEKKKGKKKNKK
jgi:predicted  nucleic acid-binding Zn-ribbon protein